MNGRRIEVEVDRDRCMSSAASISIAPGTFALDAEGVSSVIATDADALEEIVEAADSCPVRAIRVHLDGAAVA